VGTSLRFARQDHVHPTDTSRAPLASPTFTGTPAGPTAAVDTNTTQLATTAFVVGQAAAVNPLMDGAVAVGTSLRYARADHVHPTDTSRAPAANPTFTGTITLPNLVATSVGLGFFTQATAVAQNTGWGTPTPVVGSTKSLSAASDMGDIRDYLLTLAGVLKTYGLLGA
jgi:hypothetical protein